MKSTIFLKSTIIILLGIFFSSISYAIGNASTYKMTVQSIQLKRDSDDTWVTISSPNQEIDIASVTAGATAASLVSGSNIPAADYDNFKLVISETFSVSGSDGTNYTKSGGAVTVTGDDSSDASTATWDTTPPSGCTLAETTESHTTTVSEQGEMTCSLNLDASDSDNYIEVYLQNDLSTPISVTGNSVVTMTFDFDTQGTINYIDYGGTNDMMFFTPPGEGTEFTITVDGTTTTISESQMKVDF